MPELTRLPLKAASGLPLVHKFYRHKESATGLLVTFPGRNYGVDGPLLYYPSELLGHDGWDTLAVTYGFQSSMEEPFAEGLEGLLQECREAVLAALSGRTYPRIGLVGKSLGAGVVAYLCGAEPAVGPAKVVYMTPALGTPFFDPAFLRTEQPSLVAIGTRDRFYNPEALEALRAQRSFELCQVPGADHSMDVAGDLDASVRAVRQVVERATSFLTA